MGFFDSFFKLSGGTGEVAVPCPFPHHTSKGKPYFESNPSAHVNVENRLFHCMVCGQGHSETSFIREILDCSYKDAYKLNNIFNSIQSVNDWKTSNYDVAGTKELANSLGISDEVVKELMIQQGKPGTLNFPVTMLGHIIDVRTYEPGGETKVKSRQHSVQGTIVPLEQLEKVPLSKTILICAGEKDMATTRSHGFHAITLTGGEMALPFSYNALEGRNVVILYDNDDAGKRGAVRLASCLLEHCNSVKVCTKFHEICINDKEDMTDYWNKYNGTKEQLIKMMNATPLFTKEDCTVETEAPLVTLAEATTSKYVNQIVRSNIQVVAVSEQQFVVPTIAKAKKIRADGEGNEMDIGATREWYLEDGNAEDILHLADNNFTEESIKANLKKLLKVPFKERNVSVTPIHKEVLYKGYVTDMFESMNTDAMPMEYVAYSIGTRLESGKKYCCTYKIAPHPYKGNQLIMIITSAIPANDSVSNFTITPTTIEHLDMIKNIDGPVSNKINTLVQKVKGMLGYDGNDTLIKLIDLSYHTVLSFNLGKFKQVRGYLDTLIVGESRVGKSSTAEALRKMYQLGTFTSLAGNSATIPGLVGGSNKVNGGAMQTKAGLIPQNHKGLIIFEEFGKCHSNIVSELTDIRSSNEVRITRVSGTLTLPAMVRMIALSNVKTTVGEIKSIASYPNGLSIITELVPTAEDIARYDLLCVLGDRGTKRIDPYWEPDTPFPTEVYQTRVRWVWSRTEDQVIIDKDVGNYIITKSNDLNETYDCHIKIFGTEAWKKLSRLAIAIAGYTVSTDDTYTNIIVNKEHVDYAYNLFIELYDNPTFRLKEYVTNERKYNEIDDAGVMLLQQNYIKFPQVLIALEQEARISRNSLAAIVGGDISQFNSFMSILVRGSFVKLSNADILPTERFRLGMARINRNANLTRIGENNA